MKTCFHFDIKGYWLGGNANFIFTKWNLNTFCSDYILRRPLPFPAFFVHLFSRYQVIVYANWEHLGPVHILYIMNECVAYSMLGFCVYLSSRVFLTNSHLTVLLLKSISMRLHSHPKVLFLFILGNANSLDTEYIDILHNKIRVVLMLYILFSNIHLLFHNFHFLNLNLLREY